jgi:hypothetical protein
MPSLNFRIILGDDEHGPADIDERPKNPKPSFALR